MSESHFTSTRGSIERPRTSIITARPLATQRVTRGEDCCVRTLIIVQHTRLQKSCTREVLGSAVLPGDNSTRGDSIDRDNRPLFRWGNNREGKRYEPVSVILFWNNEIIGLLGTNLKGLDWSGSTTGISTVKKEYRHREPRVTPTRHRV